MKEKTHNEIDWRNPSPEDIKYVRSLSKEEHGKLLSQASKAAIKGGLSKRTVEDLWQEALKKATEAA